MRAEASCTEVYTNSVSPTAAWFSDNSGSGKVVGWQTNDEIDMGQYTITITVTDSQCPVTATATYTLDVTDPCEIAPITIDAGDIIFDSTGTPSLTIDVWQP